ncbi:hypothetical protein Mal4_40980 [Maioricimonas rarisocia]|uniref:GYF domain-containing protein n=1 Tax=Maioricimonas rarisocia TaxID=2528026 RepID=A0A517ZBE3_9PLAN|nr:DUF4339 domain-containing protein [Maioricimonas rarisocia]QDU39751.1 hypothetical protein Mal4_40980 [Maioricimonas rarisocia]
MATNWYYRIVGEEFGPVDFDALFELARAGGLGPDDDVRSESADEWQSAATIVGLFPDEDEASPDPQAADTLEDADDLSSLLESVADDSGAPEATASDSRNQWFAQVFNQELGPLEFEAVAQMADDGELAPSDLVRYGVDAEWIPAEQIVGLFHESEDEDGTAASSATAADDDPDRIWYYRLGDQEHGPFGFGQVMELAAAGTIEPATHVRAGRVGAWMDAGSIVGLFPEPEEEATEATAVLDEATEPAEEDRQTAPTPRKRSAAARGAKKKARRTKKKRQPAVEKDLEEDVVSWLSDDIDEEIENEIEQRREPVAASAPVAESPPPASPVAAPPPAAPPTPPTSSAASAALTAAVDAASSATSSSRTFTPPPKAKRGKSSGPSFSFNFSTPDLGIDPKQLVVLGLLGLVLLYVFFPFESNPAPEYYDETRAIVDRIMPLYSAKAPPGEWAPVVTEVQPRVSELAEELDKLATARNPAMQQLLAIHRDYLPPVLEGKSDTPEFVFRRVTQTLDLAGKQINREPMDPATPPPAAGNAEATAAAE